MNNPPFPYFGEFLAILTAVVWANTLAIFKYHGQKLKSDDLNLFKNLVATIGLIIVVAFLGFTAPMASRDVNLIVISGIVGLGIGDTLLFSALARAGAQITGALQSLAPLFATLLASVFWKETISPQEMVGMFIVCLGTAAVIIANTSGSSLPHDLSTRLKTKRIGIAFAILAALCTGVGWVTTRFALQKTDVYSGTLIRISSAVIFSVIVKAMMGRAYSFRSSDFKGARFGWLFLASFLGSFVGLTLMSAASKYAKAGTSASLASLYPIFVIPIAYIFLKEKTNGMTIIATVVTVLGVIVMIFHS